MTPFKPASESSPLTKLPKWAQITAWVGFPTTAALFLIIWLTNSVTTRLEAQSTDISNLLSVTGAHDAKLMIYLDQSKQQQEFVGRVLVQMCVNAALTAAAKHDCINPPIR